MNDDNDGIIPDVMKAFKNRKNTKGNQDKNKAPVTKMELEALENRRSRLDKNLDYTIGGNSEKWVHENESRVLEKKIKYIKEKLSRKKGKAKDDHSRSR